MGALRTGGVVESVRAARVRERPPNWRLQLSPRAAPPVAACELR